MAVTIAAAGHGVRRIFLSLAILAMASIGRAADPTVTDDPIGFVFEEVRVPYAAQAPDSVDLALIKGFPAISKWLYQDDLQKAHWLGLKWEGKNLIEPINVIFIDSLSKSMAASADELYRNLKKAGYTDKPHHSSGYIGYLDGRFYPQLPRQRHHAFSNEPAELNNNHGRIFGPCRFEGKYFYIAAFSREKIDPVSRIMHHFGSFDRARDELAQNLNKKSAFKIVGFIGLDNALFNDPQNTTADHDGMAVILKLMDSD
jgi:hypothetical protein